jgi:hypothetical protein
MIAVAAVVAKRLVQRLAKVHVFATCAVVDR